MISHLTLGTNNIQKAEYFYSRILASCSAKQIYKSESVVFYQFPGSPTKLSITKPFDTRPATAGNGTMLALKLKSPQTVSDTYDLAIWLGAQCEGKPGLRNAGSYFGAYFRDLDGNKIAIFHRQDNENV